MHTHAHTRTHSHSLTHSCAQTTSSVWVDCWRPCNFPSATGCCHDSSSCWPIQGPALLEFHSLFCCCCCCAHSAAAANAKVQLTQRAAGAAGFTCIMNEPPKETYNRETEGERERGRSSKSSDQQKYFICYQSISAQHSIYFSIIFLSFMPQNCMRRNPTRSQKI